MKTMTRIVYAILAVGALACYGLSPAVQAVSPAPDGGYPGGNTAEGQNALFSLTSGGFNTAVGFFSLRSDTAGGLNTAIGAGALLANTGFWNTATGAGALLSNTTGEYNTANGVFALSSNTTNFENTAVGYEALFNSTGNDNTAVGNAALNATTTGSDNTATGGYALGRSTTGNNNTAIGFQALFNNSSGSFNIALGNLAGGNLTIGDYNIDIGNGGVAGESNIIRIGDDAHQGSTFIAGVYGVAVAGLTVVMDSSDHLGTLGSSRRFKEDIQPMDRASEAILALKPVTFRYKQEIDSKGIPQFGLVAEEVEKVNPALVACDRNGRPYAVRYDAVNAMLLNEFLKEHKAFLEEQRKVEAQEATIAELKAGMDALAATVKEQAALIQKVSAQLELGKPSSRTVLNDK